MSYMTVGSTASTVSDVFHKAIDFFGKTQADAAVADLARQQAAAQAAGPAPSEGFPVMTVVLLGGAGLVAWMLLKKKTT